MGIKIKATQISCLIVIIITCCDSRVSCDSIHEMRQKHLEKRLATVDNVEVDFKINAAELNEHIMRGLNMTKKPDVDLVSELFSACGVIKSFTADVDESHRHALYLQSPTDDIYIKNLFDANVFLSQH